MRTRKRLQWERDETPEGIAIYRAKRKTERALIVPGPDGGYTVVYQSQKCKRRALVQTLAEGKIAAESMRAPSRRNPLPSKGFFVGVGLGAAGAALVYYFVNKNAAASTPTTGTP